MNCKSIREAIDTATRRSGYGETVHDHLSGCYDCQRHAEEMSSLFALLGAQPRVEAPADFEFRLRAGIARAKSEPVTASGILEKLWSRSFSFGQAATAMAAIAVAATASTFYFTHQNEVASDPVAIIVPHNVPNVADQSGRSKTPMAVLERQDSSTVKTVPVRAATGNNRQQRPAVLRLRSEADISASKSNLAIATYSPKIFNRRNGQVIPTPPTGSFIGAEGAGLTKTQTVAYTF